MILVGADFLFNLFYKNGDFINESERRVWALGLEGGRYDYTILGSSRARGALELDMFDSTFGTSINLATDGSGLRDNYIILKRFLERNTTNRLFLGVDVYNLDAQNMISQAEFHELDFAIDSVVSTYKAFNERISSRDQFLLNNLKPLYLIKYNKELIYRLLKNRFTVVDSLKHLRQITRKDHLSPDRFFLLNNDSLNLGVNKNDEKMLINIIELCKLNGIDIYCFNSPEFIGYTSIQKNRDKIFSNLIQKLDSFGIDYYQNTTYNSDSTLFKDNVHISNKGKLIFTTDYLNHLNNK